MLDTSHEAPEEAIVGGTCEVSSTQPPMWLGVPRELAALLMCIAALSWLLIDDWYFNGGLSLGLVLAGVALRETVAADLWGFHNALAWLATDFRFLDASRSEWGGARLCALPLEPIDFGVSDHA